MSWSQLCLRLVVVLASAGLCIVTAVSSYAWWPVIVLLAVLTFLAARRPESPFTLALLALHAIQWVAIVPVPDGLAGWLRLLLAAVLLLLVHLGAAASVVWPERAALPGKAVRRWTLRALTVAGVTVPVWALAALVHDRSLAGDLTLTFAAMAAVALLGGTLHLMTRDTADR
jgi:hypothetical protein